MKLWMQWILQYIFRRIVVQGPDHKHNVQVVYGLMRNALKSEFSEDTHSSTEAFSRECHDSVWAHRAL